MSRRDNKRLEKIRSLPCCQCGASPRSQAAHSNFGIHGKGKGIKADDRYTLPLCHSCHTNLDQNLLQQTSTTDASVQQMKNYLDQIERYCYAEGFMLTVPDQLQWARD